MTPEERMADFDRAMDRLKKRHEALTQSVEMLLIAQQADAEGIKQLLVAQLADSENIRALARIAEMHERRITDLEGGEQS